MNYFTPPGGTDLAPSGESNVFQVGTLQYTTAYLDYKASFGEQGLELPTGGESIFIDFDSRIGIRAKVGWAQIAVAEFLYLEGSFVFSMGEQKQFVAAESRLLDDLTSILDDVNPLPFSLNRIYHDVEIMTIGAIDVRGFAGIGDFEFSEVPAQFLPEGDTADDGGSDEEAQIDHDGLVGISVENANFGMAIIKPTGLGGLVIPGLNSFLPSYIAVKAEVEFAGLVSSRASWMFVSRMSK